ncbi:hypothetical protein NDU88_004218 [Pleurodeles waltl]|uniref:Uncharacterized protein n=1 Tax=Pleurodeles waltl TaxID=8319 RepID=A0AAV7W4C1_PLEWA|nr:hypothetical protein NDU88_004218 [Pleurodeles waltl]
MGPADSDPDEPREAAAAAPGAGPRLNDLACSSGGPPGQENWSQATKPEARLPGGGGGSGRAGPACCGATYGDWRTRRTEVPPQTPLKQLLMKYISVLSEQEDAADLRE